MTSPRLSTRTENFGQDDSFEVIEVKQPEHSCNRSQGDHSVSVQQTMERCPAMTLAERVEQVTGPVDPNLDIARKPWTLATPLPITFINANVVDPASSKLLRSMTLKIKGGIVTSLAATSSEDVQLYSRAQRGYGEEDVQVVDAKDWFLCPGLIDSHVHITLAPGYSTVAGSLSASRDSNILASTYVLKAMLSRGFTTVRDTGGASKAHANATADGLVPGPRVFQGGPIVSMTGGHGDMEANPTGKIGGCCGNQSAFGAAVLVDGVAQALVVARNLMKHGADHIKVCTSGGVGSVTDSIDSTQFTVEELRAITTTVKNMKKGALVTSHCYTAEGIRHSIEGGVGGIEHGNLCDEPTAKLMAEKGVYLTPTLAVHELIATPPFNKMLLPSQLEKNEVVRTAGLKAIQYAEDAGVTVCYGTDTFAAMDAFQTLEFVTRASVLPSPTVLKHATTNPSKMLGMEGKIGTLQPGAFGDVVIMNKNPLEDVTIFDRYRETQLAVLKEGRVMKSRLKELKAEVSLV